MKKLVIVLFAVLPYAHVQAQASTPASTQAPASTPPSTQAPVSTPASAQPPASTTVDVTAFGVQPNSFVDAEEGVNKAIDSCRNLPGAVLVFPRGRYDFWPEKAPKRTYYISNTSSRGECPSKVKTIGLLFRHMSGLTVEGNGSLFVFHGKMITWALDSCTDIRLQNISVDFDRPTMSEMTFKTVTKDSIVARVHPDSRFTIIDGRLVWYGEGWTPHQSFSILVDPVTGVLKYSSWEPFLHSKAEVIGPLTISFKGDFSKCAFLPGQVLTIRDPVRDEVGAFINQSRDVTLKNVNMHYMHGLGIIAQFSENLFYDSVNVEPAAGSGRMIASFADCMHFSGCKGYIRVENCRFNGAHDDPINIHGTQLQIVQIVSGTSLKLRFMHPQTYGMQAFFPGDSIAFVHSKSLQLYDYSTITRATLISDMEMVVELDKPVPDSVKTGDCLENLTWTPSVVIRGCRFERTLTRGILVTTRRPVLIENNIFFRTGMQAILIADDATSWFESGEVRDVTIRHNTFDECGYNSGDNDYAIDIRPENHEVIPGYMVHRNIRIEDNAFRIFDYAVLAARSTGGLVFEHNTILHSTFMQPRAKEAAAFKLTACTSVRIKNNRFDLPWAPLAEVSGMSAKDFIVEGCRLTSQTP